jgi:hypothetical protein
MDGLSVGFVSSEYLDWPRERLQQARRRAIVDGWRSGNQSGDAPHYIDGDRPLMADGIPYPILSRHRLSPSSSSSPVKG